MENNLPDRRALAEDRAPDVAKSLREVCRGNHRLVVIYNSGSDMESAVVRWCKLCGAVVVDVDCDGRTMPGGIMKMRLPEWKP